MPMQLLHLNINNILKSDYDRDMWACDCNRLANCWDKFSAAQRDTLNILRFYILGARELDEVRKAMAEYKENFKQAIDKLNKVTHEINEMYLDTSTKEHNNG
jgi:hypothetical protein